VLPIQVMDAMSCSIFHRRLLGAAKSFVSSGLNPISAFGGFIGGGGGSVTPVSSDRERKARAAAFLTEQRIASTGGFDLSGTLQDIMSRFGLTSGQAEKLVGSGGKSTLAAGGPCPGVFSVQGPDGTCIDLTALPPGGRPAITRSDFGNAVTGAFGIPALEPASVPSTRLLCPSGMVLGRDNLCYPTQVLRRDSRFRKWRPGARPILTGGQRKAISKARTAITTARDAISGLGVTVKKK